MTGLISTREPEERIKISFLTLTHFCKNMEYWGNKGFIVNGEIYYIEKIRYDNAREIVKFRKSSGDILAAMGSAFEKNGEGWVREFAFTDWSVSEIAKSFEKVVEHILQMEWRPY